MPSCQSFSTRKELLEMGGKKRKKRKRINIWSMLKLLVVGGWLGGCCNGMWPPRHRDHNTMWQNTLCFLQRRKNPKKNLWAIIAVENILRVWRNSLICACSSRGLSVRREIARGSSWVIIISLPGWSVAGRSGFRSRLMSVVAPWNVMAATRACKSLSLYQILVLAGSGSTFWQ